MLNLKNRFKGFYHRQLSKKQHQKWRQLIDEECIKFNLQNRPDLLFNYTLDHLNNQGVQVLVVDNPKFPKDHLNKLEKRIKRINWNIGRPRKLMSQPKLFGNGYFRDLDTNYTRKVFQGPRTRVRKDHLVNEDFANQLIEVKEGYRTGFNAGQDTGKNRCFVFGSSLAYSYGCEENHTLSAFLQKEPFFESFQVFNRGIRGSDSYNTCLALLKTRFSSGDLVIIFGFNPINRDYKPMLKKSYNFLDLGELFQRPHDFGDVFIDSQNHLSPRGYKVVAKKINDHLNSQPVWRPTPPITHKENLQVKTILEARNQAGMRYIDEGFPDFITKLKTHSHEGIHGAAAMNCNPFTRGHQHLVEQASKQVDHLYLFVLEEDRSYFAFKDRFAMVQKGVEHLPNVTVLSTGKFMISSLTFPDYFNKENAFNPDMDFTYDFDIFVHFIAPVLNIKKRFIGTEPFCKTTAFQHEAMKKTLPPQGIEVIEVPRLKNGNQAISASRVRELLSEKNTLSQLEKLLPQSTINHLINTQHLSI